MMADAFSNNFVSEPARSLPISSSCDVLVCGGGIAGVSAALAAARHGADVLLIEREFALGGLATLGLITYYLPLCDGCGRQVSFGIAEELLHLSAVHGFEGDNDNPWLIGGSLEDKKKRRFRLRYNANLFAIDMEDLLRRVGVRLLYGSSVCAVKEDGGRISHVIIENKSGRSAIKTRFVIDATGDADICALSSEDTEVFSQGNIPAAWFYFSDKGGYKLNPLGFSDIPDSQKSAEQLERDKSSTRFIGLDSAEITELCLLTHRMLKDEFLKDGEDSPEHALTTIATIPQLRMTRRLAGKSTPDDDSMHSRTSDSIGLISDWRRSGPVYEIPFGCLLGGKVSNLLAAGRCISVTDAMWDITRVIPPCAVTGQAAGTSAALFNDLSACDVRALQNALRSDGVVLHEDELA